MIDSTTISTTVFDRLVTARLGLPPTNSKRNKTDGPQKRHNFATLRPQSIDWHFFSWVNVAFLWKMYLCGRAAISEVRVGLVVKIDRLISLLYTLLSLSLSLSLFSLSLFWLVCNFFFPGALTVTAAASAAAAAALFGLYFAVSQSEFQPANKTRQPWLLILHSDIHLAINIRKFTQIKFIEYS